MKRIYGTIWLFLWGVSALAQGNFVKDTLEVRRILDESANLLRKNPDSAAIFAHKALDISKRANYERGKAFCYDRLARVYEAKKQYEKAIETYQAAYNIWEKLQNKEFGAYILNRMAFTAFSQNEYEKSYLYCQRVLQMNIRSRRNIMEAHMNAGNVKLTQGNYSSALAHFQEALKLAEVLKDEYVAATLYNNIAIVYDKDNMYQASLDAYLQAIERKRKLKETKSLATSINNVGVVYKKMKMYGKALQSYQEALKMREQIGDKQGVSSTLNNIGILYRDQKEYKKAADYYERALKIKQEVNDKLGIVHSFTNIAVLAVDMKEYDKGIEYGEKALELAKSLKVLAQQSDASDALYTAYKAKGDTGKALEYYELHKKLADSLFTVEKSKAIANLEARAALERKEQQLINVSKDNELNQRKREIAEKHAEANRLLSLAREEKDKRKADSLTALATKHRLEAGKLTAENLRIEADNRRKEAERLREEAEKKAYKAESQKQREAGEFQKKMFFASLAGLCIVSVLMYFVYRSRQAQKMLNVELSQKTEELQTMNEELIQTQEETIAQRDFIEEQHKTLTSKNHQITQSITTALAIQTAVLPFEQRVRKIVKDFFVLYRPRDIVSGDFYWIEQVGKDVIVVAGDCTGHGVPGAFMSLIAINILERIVLQQDIVMPAEILRKMHELVHHMLKQDELNEQSGMDMAIAKITGENICFAGAKRPLHYIDAASPTEVRTQAGSRKSIGGMQNELRDFEEFVLHLPEGSIFYLSSDGLADQNNAKRKRLREEPVFETLLQNYHSAMEEQKMAVQRLLDEHMIGTEQRDDILLLGVKI